MNAYSNDSVVADMTRKIVDGGARVFQIFQRGSEADHIRFLLDEFNPPSGTVLDIGCGVGEVARVMKEMRSDLDFILLNISQAQLDMCPPFRKICADAADIPLPDESVDAVMACYVLGHLDHDTALREMRRVIRPGGVLFVADMSGGEIPDLDYTAYDIGGYCPKNMNTREFDKFMPDFATRYPHIRPSIMREVKA
mgnify:CR=1 FL=1|tara:strand:- start:2810 stop:3397 length:588 start_codon:yes stop_codon:yes gene_type:complete